MTETVGWRVSTDFGWFTDLWLEPHRKGKFAELTARLESCRGQKVGPLDVLDEALATVWIPTYMKNFYQVAFRPKDYARYPAKVTAEEIREALQAGYRGFNVVNKKGTVECEGVALEKAGPGWSVRYSNDKIAKLLYKDQGLRVNVDPYSALITLSSQTRGPIMVDENLVVASQPGALSQKVMRDVVEAVVTTVWDPVLNHNGMELYRGGYLPWADSLATVKKSFQGQNVTNINFDSLDLRSGNSIPLSEILFDRLRVQTQQDGREYEIHKSYVESPNSDPETDLGKMVLLARVFGGALK